MSENKISLPQGPELTEKDFSIKKSKPALCCTASLTFGFVLYLIYLYPIPRDIGEAVDTMHPGRKRSVIIIYTCQNINL